MSENGRKTMTLPDYYEADRMADAIQLEYDRKCEAFPRCDQCGGSLYPHDTYTELGDCLYCETCVDHNTHAVADLASDIFD